MEYKNTCKFSNSIQAKNVAFFSEFDSIVFITLSEKFLDILAGVSFL